MGRFGLLIGERAAKLVDVLVPPARGDRGGLSPYRTWREKGVKCDGGEENIAVSRLWCMPGS